MLLCETLTPLKQLARKLPVQLIQTLSLVQDPSNYRVSINDASKAKGEGLVVLLHKYIRYKVKVCYRGEGVSIKPKFV